MNNLILKISLLPLALVMLFSTTGVAVYHHICQCHLADRSVQQTGPGSCCKPAIHDVYTTASCCSGSGHTCCSETNHKGCRNEVTYLRAPIVSTMPVQEEPVGIPTIERPGCRMQDTGYLADNDFKALFLRSPFLPPRIHRSLIIFLNTLKIPSPEEVS